MIILIILLIIIIIVCLLLLKKYKEHFNNKSIEFVEKDSVCKMLKKINYTYNKLDISIRDIPKQYHNKIHKYYCDNIIEFNNLEKKLIKWVVDGMMDKIPKHLQFIIKNLKFAKYQDHIENGFPHTNSNIIFFTGSFISPLVKLYNENDLDEAISQIGFVIIHEAVHIWQRKEPKIFLDLYNNYWNFVNVDKIYNVEYLDKLKRYNPDGVDTNWIFKIKGKYIYILSIYLENAKNIGDVKFIGIYVEKNGEKFVIPTNSKQHVLSNIKEFNDFFNGIYGNHYHPNELSAEIISVYYLNIMNLDGIKYDNTGYDNMLVWLEKYLKN